MKLSPLAPAALLLLLPLGCTPARSAEAPAPSAEPTAQTTTADAPDQPTIREALPGLYTSGQPSASQWEALRERGITTVISLRTAEEMAGRDEAAEARAAGLAHHVVEVAGPGDLGFAKADEVRALIDAAPGPVLVHCSSGNRAGSIAALIASRRGMSPEEALEVGRAAGMTSAEPKVRALLEAEATGAR